MSLLDFEHSAIAPRQLDIHSVVNLALIPYNKATLKDVVLLGEKSHKNHEYVNEMIHIFKPLLAKQSDKDLLVGYNILFRQRFFEFWLSKPTGGIEECDPYQKLVSLSDGNGGYLSKLLQ